MYIVADTIKNQFKDLIDNYEKKLNEYQQTENYELGEKMGKVIEFSPDSIVDTSEVDFDLADAPDVLKADFKRLLHSHKHTLARHEESNSDQKRYEEEYQMKGALELEKEIDLEELKNAINDFHMNEFNHTEEDGIKEIKQNDSVPLVYQTLGDDDELEIQATLNVADKRIEKVVSGSHVEEVEYMDYDSIQDIIEDLEENEFDYFIELDEIDKEELIEKNNAYLVSESNEQTKEDTDTLGTVMYEPNNKSQQSLLVENLKTGKNHEYAINNMNIQADGKQIPLSKMLDSKNLTEMNQSIKSNEPTSFMLNKNEMQKVDQQGLTKGLETNIPDNKQEALLELKEQYTSFQHALKEESKGELTEEKVINRMEIENKYNSSKTEVTETYPESRETIQMMEKNVRSQQTKSNQNNLNM